MKQTKKQKTATRISSDTQSTMQVTLLRDHHQSWFSRFWHLPFYEIAYSDKALFRNDSLNAIEFKQFQQLSRKELSRIDTAQDLSIIGLFIGIVILVGCISVIFTENYSWMYLVYGLIGYEVLLAIYNFVERNYYTDLTDTICAKLFFITVIPVFVIALCGMLPYYILKGFVYMNFKFAEFNKKRRQLP